MNDKQPDPLRLADELLEPIENFPAPTALEKQAAALLRIQHATIVRKDALLRQALWNLECDEGWVAQVRLVHAIKQELSQ